MDISWLTPPIFISICSFVAACCSLCVALFNYRRSNNVVVGLESFKQSFHSTVGENSAEMFCEVRVLLRNLGIPMHDVSMWLHFEGEGGKGTTELQMGYKKSGDGVHKGQFAKGMMAEFFLKSYTLSDFGRRAVEGLKDARSQRARLIVKSDDYTAAVIPLYSRWAIVKQLWNVPAQWLNAKRAQRYFKKKNPSHRLRLIPCFKLVEEQVRRFAEGCRKEQARSMTNCSLTVA